jgi:HSP20 family protein
MATSLNNLPNASGLMDMNQLLRQLFEPMGGFPALGHGKGATGLGRLLNANWYPTVDIRHEANQYVIHADVPGVTSKDIEVSVANGNTLIIKGKKETQSEKKSNNYVRIERSAGAFCRSVTLPSSVNAAKIRAKVKNGVLEIVAQKLGGGRGAPKRIRVTSEK